MGDRSKKVEEGGLEQPIAAIERLLGIMARSPGFGSTARDCSPYSDSVSLRLP